MTQSTRLIAACAGVLGFCAAAGALAAPGGGHAGGMGGAAAGHASSMGAMPTHASGPMTSATTMTAMPTSKPAASSTAPTGQLGPTSTGQPNQTCGSATAPLTPGGAASAPGSAFNPDGKAGTVYAGQQTQNSKNTASVSQYDVACSHQPH